MVPGEVGHTGKRRLIHLELRGSAWFDCGWTMIWVVGASLVPGYVSTGYRGDVPMSPGLGRGSHLTTLTHQTSEINRGYPATTCD